MDRVTVTGMGDSIRVRVPMKLRKRSGRKMVIVPEGMENARVPNADYQGTLVIALARAYLWEEMLESGKFNSIRELSETLGLDSAYVARIMRLTLLSPEIAKAIIEGHEPSGLSYRMLAKPFPILWRNQASALGITDTSR